MLAPLLMPARETNGDGAVESGNGAPDDIGMSNSVADFCSGGAGGVGACATTSVLGLPACINWRAGN